MDVAKNPPTQSGNRTSKLPLVKSTAQESKRATAGKALTLKPDAKFQYKPKVSGGKGVSAGGFGPITLVDQLGPADDGQALMQLASHTHGLDKPHEAAGPIIL